jgi:23S rRNA pseudouridine2605 synthase
LTHARFGIEKEYPVHVACPEFGERHLEQLRQGVILEDGLARALRANLVRPGPREAIVRVVLIEGRQREVRRMLAAVGCGVEQLQRVRIGPLLLGDLKPAQHRELRPREVDALRAAVGLEA